jgi:hypothetical protein
MYTNSYAYAQIIAGNAFIITPPHDSEHPSCWHYGVQRYTAAVTRGTPSTPNFIKLSPVVHLLLNTHKRVSGVKV